MYPTEVVEAISANGDYSPRSVQEQHQEPKSFRHWWSSLKKTGGGGGKQGIHCLHVVSQLDELDRRGANMSEGDGEDPVNSQSCWGNFSV